MTNKKSKTRQQKKQVIEVECPIDLKPHEFKEVLKTLNQIAKRRKAIKKGIRYFIGTLAIFTLIGFTMDVVGARICF